MTIFDGIFLFRAVTRARLYRAQNPERRTPSNHNHHTVYYIKRGEVRKFRGFEARSLSLFDDESQRLFKSAPSLLLD